MPATATLATPFPTGFGSLMAQALRDMGKPEFYESNGGTRQADDPLRFLDHRPLRRPQQTADHFRKRHERECQDALFEQALGSGIRFRSMPGDARRGRSACANCAATARWIRSMPAISTGHSASRTNLPCCSRSAAAASSPFVSTASATPSQIRNWRSHARLQTILVEMHHQHVLRAIDRQVSLFLHDSGRRQAGNHDPQRQQHGALQVRYLVARRRHRLSSGTRCQARSVAATLRRPVVATAGR